MTTRFSRGLYVPYLMIVTAGLSYLNWWQATTSIDISPIEPPLTSEMPVTPLPDTPADHGPASLQALSETIARPLFRSNRKPPGAKPGESAAPAIQQPPPSLSSADTLRLVGMMRAGNSARRALIRAAGVPTATWVETGGEVGGWTVGKIEASRVTLERNGEKTELNLFAPNPATEPKP